MKLKNNMLLPIAFIVVGVLLFIFKGEVLCWAATLLGALVLVYGIYCIVKDNKEKRDTSYIYVDIALIIIGVLLIVFAWVFVTIIRVLLGIFFIIDGILKAINLTGGVSTTRVLALTIEAVALILLGVLLFFDKPILYYFVGSILIAEGIFELIYGGFVIKKYKIGKKKQENPNVMDAEITVINDDVK